MTGVVEVPGSEQRVRDQNITLPIRAVIGRRSNGTPLMFAIQLDGLDNQVKGIDAVDFACHAIGTAWNGAKAFGEVEQTRDTPGIGIKHEQQRTGAVFYPREQEEMIGAEVEHRRETRAEIETTSAHWQRR